jgi:hypothetical protein
MPCALDLCKTNLRTTNNRKRDNSHFQSGTNDGDELVLIQATSESAQSIYVSFPSPSLHPRVRGAANYSPFHISAILQNCIQYLHQGIFDTFAGYVTTSEASG